MSKTPVYNITTLDTNKHARATKIGTIIGRMTLPVGMLAGVAYVVNKTQNI